MEYKKIETSTEVWAVIRARHHEDLVVFGTLSEPDGGHLGSDIGLMMTSYGFKGADFPIIETVTTWTIDRVTPHLRVGEAQQYWMCIPVNDDE